MKRFAALLVSAVLFVACGDDSSSSASAPALGEELSSSSVESNNVSSSSAKSGGSSVKSSSSVTPESSSCSVSQEESSSSAKSSSSVILESNPASSSSTESSSSLVNLPSLDQSSSSVTLATPCKTETEDNCEYGELVDERDARIYKTVKIGDQVWMAENVNYFDETLDGISWCYDNDPKNCETWGRLYTWAAAIDSVGLYDDGNGVECGSDVSCSLPDTVLGICPSGWHLPSETEFKTLVAAVGGDSTAAKMLKSQTGWNDDGNGTDDFGFFALPAGIYNEQGFSVGGSFAAFWGATVFLTKYANIMSLPGMHDKPYLIDMNKNFGLSVRCIKNEP